ncbi:unnamed protein product [Protopolystoma xenopodis]|uniref:Myosin motor domain-containing protein n=1 Tax=Protopolystoma xenopodis TaxID=117903 RepID=A0A3S5C0Z4_9PLAT|nr:unnamed protein product [Protopolystoma xenopodis]
MPPHLFSVGQLALSRLEAAVLAKPVCLRSRTRVPKWESESSGGMGKASSPDSRFPLPHSPRLPAAGSDESTDLPTPSRSGRIAEQAICLLGRSGSGKTHSVAELLAYLVHSAAPPPSPLFSTDGRTPAKGQAQPRSGSRSSHREPLPRPQRVTGSLTSHSTSIYFFFLQHCTLFGKLCFNISPSNFNSRHLIL